MQHDYDISTSDANTGIAMRAAINAALQALATTNAGTPPPAVTYPCMLWADTANDLLKIRNVANTSWITVGQLSLAGLGLMPQAATQDAIADGVTYKRLTAEEKTKLAGIEAGAQVNIAPDWNAESGAAQILNKPATLGGYGITDAYTITEIDNLLGAVYYYRGSVATYAALPAEGLGVGDVYNVLDTGKNYAWTGEAWDNLGGVEPLATLTNDGLMSMADFAKLAGIEAGADVTDALNVAAAIHCVSEKSTPSAADELALIDASDSYALKKTTLSAIKNQMNDVLVMQVFS